MKLCRYCERERELCASHAIPDGVFKAVSRQSNGNLIVAPKGAGKIHRSQNTGKALLLCKECEGLFNRKFDGPLVNALKAWDRKIINEGFGAKIKFSSNQMTQSLASVFWRASVSSNELYASAQVSSQDNIKLRAIFDSDPKKALKMCSCAIKRIYDKQSPADGGFPQENLSQIILPVQAYRAQGAASHVIAFSVLIQGFLCHLMIPRLPFSQVSKPEFLKPNRERIHAPAQYFMDYPPIREAMIVTMEKHLAGHSTLKS